MLKILFVCLFVLGELDTQSCCCWSQSVGSAGSMSWIPKLVSANYRVHSYLYPYSLGTFTPKIHYLQHTPSYKWECFITESLGIINTGPTNLSTVSWRHHTHFIDTRSKSRDRTTMSNRLNDFLSLQNEERGCPDFAISFK